jgi:hypothetical protein
MRCHNNRVYAYRKIIIASLGWGGGKRRRRRRSHSIFRRFDDSNDSASPPYRQINLLFPIFSVIYYVLFIPRAVLSSASRFPSFVSAEFSLWWCICKFILSEREREALWWGAMSDYLSNRNITCSKYHPSKFTVPEWDGRAECESTSEWFINRRNKSSNPGWERESWLNDSRGS